MFNRKNKVKTITLMVAAVVAAVPVFIVLIGA